MGYTFFVPMLSRNHYKDLVWIDLESPSKDEVRRVMKEFDLHPLIAEELLTPSAKPKAERYQDMLYVVLRFPVSRHSHGGREDQEVDFVIGKKFLITTHYDIVDPIHKFSKVFEVNSILKENDIGDHAGHLFCHILRKLYRSVEHELEYLNDYLREIEDHIFSGMEQEMVVEISRTGRVLLSFKHSLMHHQLLLESLEGAGRSFFGEPFGYHIRTIIGEYNRIENTIEAYTGTIAELRETNNSLVSTKQNETMKILTIISVFTFPLSLIAVVFSMNTPNNPVAGSPYDFWIVVGMMFAAAAALFAFFKYKKWL